MLTCSMLFDKVIVQRQEELLLDKRFVAAEQAILSHNLHTHTIPHTYKTAMFSANAAAWSMGRCGLLVCMISM
jgi:hypothetical protein